MEDEPRFFCDAMLGGLARWLRAAGYTARFDVHIADGELVRRCLQEGYVLLSSDSGLLERYALTEGLVDYVFVPQGLSPIEQLAHVMGQLDLPLKQPRCMDCGDELEEVDLPEVRERVPPKVRARMERFFRCAGCGKVYWRGTHWESIRRKLRKAVQAASGDRG
ncbi:MAG: Mut7-C RNAse domain-containing protein [Candidatus Brocadiia bacterium]